MLLVVWEAKRLWVPPIRTAFPQPPAAIRSELWSPFWPQLATFDGTLGVLRGNATGNGAGCLYAVLGAIGTHPIT